MIKFILLITITLITCGCKQDSKNFTATNIKLHKLYSDHMVLQREQPIKIIGYASKNSTLEITFDKETLKVTSDKDGNYQAIFSPRKAGGPYQMTLKGNGEMLTLNDILIGDVWFCTGQSNMWWPMRNAENATSEIAKVNNPQIRLFKINDNALPYEISDFKADDNYQWQLCNSKNVTEFSAVGYYFGANLQAELGIPIGLISSNYGGAPIEAFLNLDSIKKLNLSSELAIINKFNNNTQEELQELYHQEFVNYLNDMRKYYSNLTNEAKNWINNDNYNEANWSLLPINAPWESHFGYPFDGVIWHRAVVNIPESWQNQELLLSLGSVDDCDTTYFNGNKVGATDVDTPQYWIAKRQYKIPKNLVKVGENVILVRVEDFNGEGGMMSPANELFLQIADKPEEKIHLPQVWRSRTEYGIDHNNHPKRPEDIPNPYSQYYPTGIFNGMVKPFLNYPIKGIVFYQGETNSGAPEKYKATFDEFFLSYKKHWNNPNLALFFVQLAPFEPLLNGSIPENFFDNKSININQNWARLREAQNVVLKYPNTGKAVILDVGNPIDIHPRDKKTVGKRLALEALQISYNKDIISKGPIVESTEVKRNKVIVSFKNNKDSKLISTDNQKLRNFTIAGNDQVFYHANASINNDQKSITISANEVQNPKYIRYAFDDCPIGINFYNDAMLPAEPFNIELK